MRSSRPSLAVLVVPIFFATAALAAPAGKGGPSRPAVKGCAWRKAADPKVGLEAWVQQCDFGFRKIDFLFRGSSLAIRFSDGGDPDPLVDVLGLEGTETPEAGVRRIFASGTPAGVASRCVLRPWRGGKAPSGVERYTFVPDAAYAKELAKKADPDEVPEPPCGDWGEAPDGIRYFEAQPASGARKVLFVRVGQDEPLFDEQSLKLLPAR
jgi:hypothetical protein